MSQIKKLPGDYYLMRTELCNSRFLIYKEGEIGSFSPLGFSESEATAFANCMNHTPDAAQAARIAELEEELRQYREPKSEMGKKVMAYLANNPNASVRQVAKAMGITSPSHANHHIKKARAALNSNGKEGS
jgi:hypothetical protein